MSELAKNENKEPKPKSTKPHAPPKPRRGRPVAVADPPKKKRTPRKKKSAAKKVQPRRKRKPLTSDQMGCALNNPGCEAGRIHDWKRGKHDAASLYVKGELKLCATHLQQLTELVGVALEEPASSAAAEDTSPVGDDDESR